MKIANSRQGDQGTVRLSDLPSDGQGTRRRGRDHRPQRAPCGRWWCSWCRCCSSSSWPWRSASSTSGWPATCLPTPSRWPPSGWSPTRLAFLPVVLVLPTSAATALVARAVGAGDIVAARRAAGQCFRWQRSCCRPRCCWRSPRAAAVYPAAWAARRQQRSGDPLPRDRAAGVAADGGGAQWGWPCSEEPATWWRGWSAMSVVNLVNAAASFVLATGAAGSVRSWAGTASPGEPSPAMPAGCRAGRGLLAFREAGPPAGLDRTGCRQPAAASGSARIGMPAAIDCAGQRRLPPDISGHRQPPRRRRCRRPCRGDHDRVARLPARPRLPGGRGHARRPVPRSPRRRAGPAKCLAGRGGACGLMTAAGLGLLPGRRTAGGLVHRRAGQPAGGRGSGGRSGPDRGLRPAPAGPADGALRRPPRGGGHPAADARRTSWGCWRSGCRWRCFWPGRGRAPRRFRHAARSWPRGRRRLAGDGSRPHRSRPGDGS